MIQKKFRKGKDKSGFSILNFIGNVFYLIAVLQIAGIFGFLFSSIGTEIGLVGTGVNDDFSKISALVIGALFGVFVGYKLIREINGIDLLEKFRRID